MAAAAEQVFAIVGGGLTAATAAQTLRDEGFAGRIRVFAAESHQPYNRPPLSKEYLTGSAERESVFVQHPDWYAERRVELELGAVVRGIDPAGHTIDLGNGRVERYDKALLATGAIPRHLEVPGRDLDGIHYLRTIDDSDRLRDGLAAGGRRVVVIGSGWIGLETAAAARRYGNDVTVIGRSAVPLRRTLGPEIGGVFADLHRDNGVTLNMSRRLIGLQGGGRVTGVETDAGPIAADVVICGIGAQPNVHLARAAGLELTDGVAVDAGLRTSAPDVFAAGDIADQLHPVLGTRIRSEHWANALGQGAAAARSMLGQSIDYAAVPYFYTDQFDLGMEYSGYPSLAADAEVVVRGDLAAREFIAFWVRDGRVVAGMNVNIWDVNEELQRLIREGTAVTAERLADADVPLAEL